MWTCWLWRKRAIAECCCRCLVLVVLFSDNATRGVIETNIKNCPAVSFVNVVCAPRRCMSALVRALVCCTNIAWNLSFLAYSSVVGMSICALLARLLLDCLSDTLTLKLVMCFACMVVVSLSICYAWSSSVGQDSALV